MLSDVFVLADIALMGQFTVIYAKPNTGKTLLTLHLLIESILEGVIKADDIFYINADDTYKGLIVKLELAEKYNFQMIAPGHKDFESTKFMSYLTELIANDNARGKILILDTLKKFTELTDKKVSSNFMKKAREFVSHGGTLISLAHTNKNRDANGNLVAGGTSDIPDDADCCYTLGEISHTNNIKSVLFVNFKLRGDCLKEAGFTYSTTEGESYIDILNSVMPLDGRQVTQAKKMLSDAEELKKDQSVIDAITEALTFSPQLKTDLTSIVNKDYGVSIRIINDILKKYEGKSILKGHMWFVIPADKNSKIYTLLTADNCDK